VLYQVVRKDNDEITVNVVPKDDLFSPEVAERTRTKLADILGHRRRIEIVPVRSVSIGATGKIQCFKK